MDHAESAWLLIDPSTDPERAALVQARRCWLLMVLDQVDRASLAAEQALALLPGDAALIAVAEVHVRVALVMGSTGRAEEARRSARLALDAATAAGDERLKGRAMRELGSWGSDPLDQQSSELLQGAWDRAVTIGDPEDIAGIGVILSERLFRSGLPEKSARTALDAHHLLATMTDSGHWMDSILVANACKSLMAVGRWDEAGALLDRACALDPFGASRLARVRLLIARGALDQAEDDLGQAKHLQRHDQPYFGLEYDELLAELRLWRKDPLGALSDVVDTLDKLDDTAVHDLGAGLCALGVRAAADLAEGARATHDERRLELALDNGRRLAKTQTVADPDAPARRATVSGELGRLEREPQPSAWETAAREWGTRRRPYDRALALWRQAEAVLETGVGRGVATTLLHEAAAIAESLGAA